VSIVAGEITIGGDGTVTGAGVGVAGLAWSYLVADPAVVIPDDSAPPAGFTAAQTLVAEVAAKKFYAAIVNALGKAVVDNVNADNGAPRAVWSHKVIITQDPVKYDVQGEAAPFTYDDGDDGFSVFVDGEFPIKKAVAFVTQGTGQIVTVAYIPGNTYVALSYSGDVQRVTIMVW